MDDDVDGVLDESALDVLADAEVALDDAELPAGGHFAERGDRARIAARVIVHDGDGVSLVHQPHGGVGADEPGAARHQHVAGEGTTVRAGEGQGGVPAIFGGGEVQKQGEEQRERAHALRAHVGRHAA